MINLLCYSFVYLVFNFCSILGQNLPQNPCPDYFSYERNGNNYVGVIQIVAPEDTLMVRMDVTMTIGIALRSNYIGSTEFREEVFDNLNQRIYIYDVYFPSGPIPKLKQITVNGELLCNGPSVQSNFLTTIELGHSQPTRMTYVRRPEKSKYLNSNFEEDTFFNSDNFFPPIYPTIREHNHPIYRQTQPFSNQQPSSFRQYSPTQQFSPNQQFSTTQQSPPIQRTPVQQPPPETVFQEEPAPQINPPSRNINSRTSIECGRIAHRFQSTPLIVNGEGIDRGSWPWLAAIQSYNTDTLEFICGGSLISSRAVLSAAHCFVKSTESRIQPESYLIQLGRFNRSVVRENGMEEMPVRQIVIHEDYALDRINGYDADLAIVILQSAVEFTDFIRPICLPNPRDRNTLQGTVVGWGKTEFNEVSPTPKKVSAPIVTESVCVKSHELFKSLISSRTFCAGLRNGSGPCAGDSGGALGIEINNRWYIHGTVSASLASRDSNCDVSNYIIYADVVQFVDWILEHIRE